MDLALLLNVHKNDPVVMDTIESISAYATNNILVLVDGFAWEQFEKLPVNTICGFKHGSSRSPYRNVALGLQMLFETYPDSEWYCCTEYDVLFTSERFKKNLEIADKMGVWMLGNEGHIDDKEMSFVESIIGERFKSYYYLLGCCHFFNRKFIQKLVDIDFFNKFLNLTNHFQAGYMPGYSGYNLNENMYPSLCRHFGGNIGVFASYDENGDWHGAYQHFPMRWRPEIDIEKETYPYASLIHPIKSFSHPIRIAERKKRNGI